MENFKVLIEAFSNWFKKSLATLIIFILIGMVIGIYCSKIAYNIRMNEIGQVGGYVFDNKIYDVKQRP